MGLNFNKKIKLLLSLAIEPFATGRRDSALEGTYQFLLSESDFQKINNKLIDDTDNEYKEALRKHVLYNYFFLKIILYDHAMNAIDFIKINEIN